MKEKKSHPDLKGHVARLFLILACFLWALSFIASKTALESTPPMTVVSLRLLVSAACFLAWAVYAQKNILAMIRNGGLKLFMLTLSGTVLHYGTQTIGIEYTTASNASLYAVTAPISIALISLIFFGEKLGIGKIIGILTALFGVITVMGLGVIKNFAINSVIGDSLVFISIVMWGVFTVFGKETSEKMGGAVNMTAAVTITGALAMLPLGAGEIYIKGFSLSNVAPEAWASIFFLGITCSFAATFLYFKALESMNSNEAGTYLYSIPPMTSIIAYFYSNEQITLTFMAGALLVLTGVFITEKS